MTDLTKSELDRRRSVGGQKLHEIKVIVQRITPKAFLLMPLAFQAGETAVLCWVPRSQVDLGVSDEEALSTEYHRGLIAVMPEWLLIEKGWENYVETK